ncbi:MAG: hypothetical protein FJ294_11190 [Planctomycetes bacterium]|nr:hypothetical protein [Planctomycetota bacterium]
MLPRDFSASLFVLPLVLCACGGEGEALRAARADIRAGALELAESKLAAIEGEGAAALLAQVVAARREREQVAARIEELLAGAGTATENQLRERLRALRDTTQDPRAREQVVQILSDLRELVLKRGGAGAALAKAPVPEVERSKDARDELIARVRGEVKEALRERQWQRAEELIWMLSEQPYERTGDLAPLRAELLKSARGDAEQIAAQAVQLEREQGAAEARAWLVGHMERFPRSSASELLRETLRGLDRGLAGGDATTDTAAEADVARARTQPFEATARVRGEQLLDRRGSAQAELLLSPPVPEEAPVETLAALARENAHSGQLAFARQCWLAASRKLPPGDLRDDYIGEAQDLRARLALRAELLDAYDADPAPFRNLGVDGMDGEGWIEGGALRPWSGQYFDMYKRAGAVIDLSALARRGIVCEILRSGDEAERERAFADLGRMVERGDLPAVDAANIIARARGGLGSNERYLLEKGRWITGEQAARAVSAEQDEKLSNAFRKAGAAGRDAAFEALLAGASEPAARAALNARTLAALKDLDKDRTAQSLRALADLRKELDSARKVALEHIFDEDTYFYPYAPPEPPHTAGEYARAQQKVDELVSAVRAVAARSKPVKSSKEFRALAAELEWCRAVHQDLGIEFQLGDSAPEYLLVQDGRLAEIELLSFAWSASEADDLAYDRSVLAYNERLFGAYAKRKDAPADELPNVAEQQQVRITNGYRMLMGRRAVAWNPRIQVAAQGHSDYMANTGNFGHFEEGDPQRRSPFDRMKLAGYPRDASENCAMVGGDPQAAHDGWLHSSGHHRNILMPGHREMASGSASNYWTQNFGADTTFQKDLEP